MLACKKGEILKKAYETKRGVHVSETCIQDRGLKGKTTEERKIEFHTVSFDTEILGAFGYKNLMHKNAHERRQALEKAIKACENNDYKTIFEMLNSGEMYKVIDPTTDLINKILDDKLEFAEASKNDAFKVINKFRQFLLIQFTLCLVVSSAVLIPKKKRSRTKKSIIT